LTIFQRLCCLRLFKLPSNFLTRFDSKVMLLKLSFFSVGEVHHFWKCHVHVFDKPETRHDKPLDDGSKLYLLRGNLLEHLPCSPDWRTFTLCEESLVERCVASKGVLWANMICYRRQVVCGVIHSGTHIHVFPSVSLASIPSSLNHSPQIHTHI
jgi:hypothetical protein